MQAKDKFLEKINLLFLILVLCFTQELCAENIYDKDWRSNKDKHPTANCLEVMLPKLRDKLKLDYNINLLAASKKSGSSKYLNTFFND